MLRSVNTLQSLYLKIRIAGTPFSFWALHARSRSPILNLQKNEEDYVSKKNIGRALEEVADNLIIIKQQDEKK